MVFQQHGCDIGNDAFLGRTDKLGRSQSLLFSLIEDAEGLGEFPVKQSAETVQEGLAELIVVGLLRCRSARLEGFGCREKGNGVLHFAGNGLHADINTIGLIFLNNVPLVENRHEVDVKVLLRMGGAALIRVPEEEVPIKHHLVGAPLQLMRENLEFPTVLFHFNGQELHEEGIPVGILDIVGHLGCIVLDFLLVVDAALDTQMEFLVLVVFLEVLTNSGSYNLGSSGFNDILEEITVNDVCIQIAEVVHKGFGSNTILARKVILEDFDGAGAGNSPC